MKSSAVSLSDCTGLKRILEGSVAWYSGTVTARKTASGFRYLSAVIRPLGSVCKLSPRSNIAGTLSDIPVSLDLRRVYADWGRKLGRTPGCPTSNFEARYVPSLASGLGLIGFGVP